LNNSNKYLKDAKHEIEEKTREIIDSINYAKGIQDAILPTDQFIKEHLQDSFVLFKPKDIVSGDFYWMQAVEKLVFFAAVDCTGHGVPGGFVSMVGANSLKRSVNEFELTKPGEILDKLTALVEETFKKRKDGMDIALCSINKENLELSYAGANNPLFIIRRGDNPLESVGGNLVEPKLVEEQCSLYEIKADKQPVGAFENRVSFSDSSYKLIPTDSVYVFTDGFPDQFGGPNGKKFMSKRFKQLLISTNQNTLKEQKLIIETEFTKWMGTLEQIDDVCVIGVRV
jgi:serine phosphatase RsbU (regulator of sigma subunit)